MGDAIDVWWIGPGVVLAMALAALVARLARHRHAGPLAVGAAVAGAACAAAWALARHVMRGRAGTLESAFVQLVIAQIGTFGLVVVAMLAAWRRGRRDGPS